MYDSSFMRLQDNSQQTVIIFSHEASRHQVEATSLAIHGLLTAQVVWQSSCKLAKKLSIVTFLPLPLQGRNNGSLDLPRLLILIGRVVGH
ncbi:hypothetical protein T4E_3595 [Trichinella pseudospiralis]|uniref:Uncharacterized protein n=1 Tax=Trichinella pseudospiralis TaxID=6337 RepID=A0A0V0XSQ1_TRIPS|nr:hypothetical protein T4E_3595 [Trichinella pseudospiralis]